MIDLKAVNLINELISKLSDDMTMVAPVNVHESSAKSEVEYTEFGLAQGKG